MQTTTDYGLTATHRQTLRDAFPVAHRVAPRHHRKPRTARTVAAVVAAGALLVAGLTALVVSQSHTQPYTAAPCAAWAGTAHPDPGPRTYTDRCLSADGTVSWASGLTTTHGVHIGPCAMGANWTARDVRSDVCEGDAGRVFSRASGVQLATY